MTNSEIKAYWLSEGQEVTIFSPAILQPLLLQEHTEKFLSIVGLPSEAAPYLSFSTNTQGSWNSIARIIDIDTALDSSFKNFIQIGSDGSGNAIAIDTEKNDIIELLDHDNGFKLIFINSSIESFAFSLVAYSRFISSVLASGEENSYFDTHFTDEQFNLLKNRLILADNDFDKSEFWYSELDMLLGNREAYKNESGD
jgi:hypothetical protein